MAIMKWARGLGAISFSHWSPFVFFTVYRTQLDAYADFVSTLTIELCFGGALCWQHG